MKLSEFMSVCGMSQDVSLALMTQIEDDSIGKTIIHKDILYDGRAEAFITSSMYRDFKDNEVFYVCGYDKGIMINILVRTVK